MVSLAIVRSTWKCHLLPGLVLVGLTIACFARLVAEPGGLLVDPERPSVDAFVSPGNRSVGNDLTRVYLPRHLQIASVFARTGHIPRWDSAGFGGRPLVGNPQAGLWYPPVWLFWWLGWPALLGWLTVGHLIAGGLGTYALGRSLGLGTWASTIAGGCFEAAPYLMAHTAEGHYPHLWAVCWFPWAFLAAVALRRGDLRGALALPPILALSFLTGHPQEAFYLTIALLAWAGFEVANLLRRKGWSEAGRALLLVGAILTITAGLLAIEGVPDSQAQTWTLRSAGLSSHRASQYSVHPINALQLIGPKALGGPADYFGDVNYWEPLLSPGLCSLVLACAALCGSPRRKSLRGWAVLVVLAVVFAAGRPLGLFSILYEIVPGMDRFRAPSRGLFLAVVGFAILVGFGVEALADRRADWSHFAKRVPRGALGLAALLLLGLGWARSSGRDAPRLSNAGDHPDGLRAALALSKLASDPVVWASIAVTTAGFAWLRVRPGDGRRVAFGLGALALTELAAHSLILLKVTPADRFLGPDAVSDALADVRPEGPFRVRARDAFVDDLRAFVMGFEKTNLNDAFQIQHAADLYQTLYSIFEPPLTFELFDPLATWFRHNTRQSVLDRMNVVILISDHPEANAPWPALARGSRQGVPFTIHANPTVMPRAYVVPRVWPCSDTAQSVSLFPWVPAREAVLMPADPLGTTVQRQPFTPADYDARDPDRVEVRVATQAPGLLVVADTWMPGWSATLDGRPVPILRGNHAQRVIALPNAGTHHVVMRYHPPGLAVGATISAVTGLCWLMISGLVLARRSLHDPARSWFAGPLRRHAMEISADHQMNRL